MGKIIKNILAVLRGMLFAYFTKFFNFWKVAGGKSLLKYCGVSINAGKNSKLSIGKKVKINRLSTISVLNGGEMLIGDGVGIGSGNSIICHEKIEIGSNTIFGPNVLVYDHDHIYNEKYGVNKKEFKTAPIHIGKNCWIGANVVILKGTTIGDGCVVGAGTVLKGEFPDDSLITQKRTTDIRVIERNKDNE